MPVLFTSDFSAEISAIRDAAQGRTRKFFVHMRGADVAAHRDALPGFTFVVFEETTNPGNSYIQTGSTEGDLFVLYNTRPAKIPDRNFGTYQSRTKGLKLAIHDHPFCGRATTFSAYFPFSYVDKSLLGFPHVYAAETAHNRKPLDPVEMAHRVAPAATTTMRKAFGKPQVVRVALTDEEKGGYDALREQVFADKKMTPRLATRALKKYVDGTATMKSALAEGPVLPILDQNRVWAVWKKGVRRVVVSDAKVDETLLTELKACMASANAFLGELSKGAA